MIIVVLPPLAEGYLLYEIGTLDAWVNMFSTGFPPKMWKRKACAEARKAPPKGRLEKSGYNVRASSVYRFMTA
jgi:hypothetical protein